MKSSTEVQSEANPSPGGMCLLTSEQASARAAEIRKANPKSRAAHLYEMLAKTLARGLAGDEANFEEGKHKRDADGKFSSTGGGGAGSHEDPNAEHGTVAEIAPEPAAEKKGAQQFKTKKEQAAHLLEQGVTTADMLKALNWPSISMPAMAKTLGMKLEKIKVNGVTKYKGTLMPKEEIAAAKAEGAKVKEAPVDPSKPLSTIKNYHFGTEASIFKNSDGKKFNVVFKDSDSGNTILIKTFSTLEGAQTASVEFAKEGAPENAPEPKPTPTPMQKMQAAVTKTAPATAAEIEKAKKNVALKIQYVPGAPDTPAAQKLVDQFNEKWAGKDISANAAKLVEKVNDFKAMQAAMVPLMSSQQQAQMEAAKKQQEQTEAQQQAAKAAAAAEAAKLAAQMSDPAVKKQYETLQEVFSGKLKANIDEAKETIAKHKLDITPYDGAFIVAYRGSAYKDLNKQLRNTKITPEQYKYAKALDHALSKMPVHKGRCVRGVSMSDAEAEKYQPGHVVIENQFNSAGKRSKLWGEWTFDIQSKTGADISSFNPKEGGGEVVFRMNTHFHVKSRVGNKIVLEEMD